MTLHSCIEFGLYLVVLVALIKPIGWYLFEVMENRTAAVCVLVSPAESFFYRLSGIDEKNEMTWKDYAVSLIVFNLIGALVVYALQRLQVWLPLNPQAFGNVSPDSSFNTAISFVTNTNWQGYSGESTMSYLTQMSGLAVQNFFSAATGVAVVIALVRGFTRSEKPTIGNFWVDVTRAVLYIFLPFAFLFAILLLGQGVIQNFAPYLVISPLESVSGVVDASANLIPMGPVASQEAIKILGTNGGGFFNANSAHPFENPTPLTNFAQMLAIFLIPAGLCYTFGKMVGDRRQGRVLLIAMFGIFILMAVIAICAEQAGNPLFEHLGIDSHFSSFQSGGNMEGKETRFGIIGSTLFSTITTATSCGATNAMLDSFTPLGGLIPMVLIQLGEVVFGGVGSGLYTILMFAIIAVFVAGLMIGRTPEYLGKKIAPFEMKMASLAILITPILVLLGCAVAVLVPAGLLGVGNPGAHGFSEILYACSSAPNNNGSAFAGLSVDTPFYNTLFGVSMWFGRFWMIIPILAIAGSLAAKKRIEAGVGILPTHGLLFICLLVGCILLVGALNYVPALALGPVVEALSIGIVP